MKSKSIKKSKKTMLSVLCIACSVVMLVSCTTKQTESTEVDSSFVFEGYPINTEETLTYWMPIYSPITQLVNNFDETPLGKELVKKTGVKIKYINPPAGQEKEQFSILMASSSLPDIIEYAFTHYYSGGAQKALSDGVILPLNNLIEKNSPNYDAYLKANPDIAKDLQTDNGDFFVYSAITNKDFSTLNYGPMLREDWLAELELAVPETIDEWRNVLTQFKEKKGATAPLSFVGLEPLTVGAFVGAYNVKKDFYIQDDTVVYGPATSWYKDALSELAAWYEEGLIDENIANVDAKTLSANVISGKTGAVCSYTGSGMGVFNKALSERSLNAALAAAPYPSVNKDEKPPIGNDTVYAGGHGGYIATACKNPALAARYLDYGYSEEGGLVYNFGVEGESYNMKDGYPKYTDIILNNPNGLSVSQAMGLYIKASTSGVFIKRKEYLEQYYTYPQQKQTSAIWENSTIRGSRLPLIGFTTEESNELADIMTNIETFVDERTYQYMMGKEDLSGYNSYMEELKQLGVDRAIEIYNAAYQRYLARN